MTRLAAIAGTAVFLLVGPGFIAGLVPWWISGWRVHSPFPGFAMLRIAGLVLVVAGSLVLLEAFARFAFEGLGTPAPVLPPQRLVVRGPYRYVRNPMYVAVLAVIMGQALLLGNVSVFLYACAAWLAMHAFVLFYEEPKLRKSFGEEYTDFCKHIPRWVPHFRPWPGSGQ